MTGEARAVGRHRVVGRAVGEILLWLAAVGGVICAVLVALALLFDVTLMMFRTGSMAPTIPSGAVAVVQQVPATQVEVGDIVTVDRGDDELPVTHRITSVAPGAVPDERIITMRGDANESDDPFPYAVTSVRTVLFSIPGAAQVIVWFGHPLVLGGLTVVAGLVVGWAFWPRERDGDASSPHGPDDAARSGPPLPRANAVERTPARSGQASS